MTWGNGFWGGCGSERDGRWEMGDCCYDMMDMMDMMDERDGFCHKGRGGDGCIFLRLVGSLCLVAC
jgi:hypothetical protein